MVHPLHRKQKEEDRNMTDLFGHSSLKEQYGANPFSVFDTNNRDWKLHRQLWLNKGILPPLMPIKQRSMVNFDDDNFVKTTSTFDPYLCELIYRWFCPENGTVLDPFCGGSVRGIVAQKLGYHYTGIDIRQDQIDSDIEQSERILGRNIPEYICGDSDSVLDSRDRWEFNFDMLFTCPPYWNLEVYSDDDRDLSTLSWKDFLQKYRSIIKKSCRLIKHGAFAVIVVGEVRNRSGYYAGLVPETIKAFLDAGMVYWNEAVLLTPYVNASKRVSSSMKNKKLVKVHQNVLIFKRKK